ncbi:M24 family metallopeptidase [Cohnella fermenti]|uniref:Aminopeptidase P family protein n=1 Tax=Cohnella fermenti TaxID=2565925 RepID=A0A4S4C985_9BACL|nr:Xaa-Pro peptidase family protein [Cohnella fermenti]THF84564.1 aminopeptidase P family protein [Cohnella fermenti]
MSRLARIREVLRAKELGAVYVSSYENRRYYSGFSGSNGHLFVTEEEACLITDPRYTEQAEKEAPQWRIATHGLDAMETIREELRRLGAATIGYESTKLTDAEVSRLRAELPEISWVPLEDYGVRHRAIKDEEELRTIREAAAIADRAMLKLVDRIRSGMTERDIQIELEYLMAKEGSEAPAFGTIVASGTRASLPHGTATDKPIARGELVVIDFGAKVRGYHSDLTRTLWVGAPEPEALRLFLIVQKARKAAIRAIRPGRTCGEIDKAHRDVFVREGVEEYSLRGLGHGVGLHIHELPRVVIGAKEPLEPGMVFTVEPGLYVPGIGGVRIEDIVRVTEDGCEVLTRCPHVLQVH